MQSFKCKDIVTVPEEDWIVVDGMHEPVIDQNSWNTALENLKSRKRSDNQGAVQIFAGMLKCVDCGCAMTYRGNPTASFQCSQYNVKGSGHCHSHYIKYDDLYEIVLEDIRRKAYAAAGNGGALLDRLRREGGSILHQKRLQAEQKSGRLENRMAELDTIIGRVYEDGVLGKITPERSQVLITAYEAEQTSVKDRLAALRIALEEAARKQSDTEIFMGAIAKYANLTELNAAILNELIDHIEIGSKETVDGEKRQRVRIHYRRAGYMTLNWWELLPYEGTYASEDELEAARIMPYSDNEFGHPALEPGEVIMVMRV